jgi:archaellum biogenesis protein FlaJ (TadC family)
MRGDGDRDSSALQDDRKLRRAKLAAGIVSVLVLVGLFVTSLFRAPAPAWTVVLIVTACALATVVGLRVRRRGRRR